MVVPGFPVLSQTFVALQIAELVARGHSVDIFSLGRRGKSSWLPSEARPRLEAIRVVHTGTPGRKRKWNVFLIPRLLSLLASKPGAVRSALTGVLLRRGFAAFSMLVADAHSMKDLSTYDLVHCQFATLAHRVLDLDATGMLETCPPVFCSVRGYDITSERHIAKARWSEVIDFVDRFLPVSRSLEARLVDLGCRVPISIVHSPVNTTRLLEAKPSGTAGGRIHLISIGRLLEKKGIIDGLRAAKILKAAGLDFHYTIVGQGALKESLERFVMSNGLEDEVTFLGGLPSDETIAALGASDVLIAPSKTGADGNAEGIPNVLKEAMLLGVQVVGTTHSGIPELIKDGKNGYLAREGDPEDIARNIALVAASRECWSDYAAAARETILAEYTPEKTTDDLIAAYRETLSQK